ncbi:MAG: GtrA family protein [Lachnospiraceae bacterium]|nr:GtrA family protein [Lachnospiraceae bacterium]
MDKMGSRLWNLLERCLHFIAYQILHMKLTEDRWQGLMQFVKFGIVGVSNSVLSYVLYALSLFVLQKAEIAVEWNYLIAQAISFVLSVLWSFYWNQKYVFVLEDGKQRSMFKALLKTYVSYSFTGLFLNSVFLSLWIQVLHISEYIAPVINLVINVPVNFLINKFWAFRNEEKQV